MNKDEIVKNVESLKNNVEKMCETNNIAEFLMLVMTEFSIRKNNH